MPSTMVAGPPIGSWNSGGRTWPFASSSAIWPVTSIARASCAPSLPLSGSVKEIVKAIKIEQGDQPLDDK